MTEKLCAACRNKLFDNPFQLLDGRLLCLSCYQGVKSGRGPFPLPTPPTPPNLIKRIFSPHSKEEFQRKLKEHESECSQLRELNSIIGHEICEYWPGGDPPDWHWRRRKVWEREGGKCEKCGAISYAYHIHHIVPRIRGGTHAFSNLSLLCTRCHSDVHVSMVIEDK